MKAFRVREWLLVLLCVGLIVGQVWLDLTMPEYMGQITVEVSTLARMERVLQSGGMMILCALGSLVLSFCVAFLSSLVGASFSLRIRRLLFYRVEDFSQADIARFSTASLITRSTNDVAQVRMLITAGLQMIVKAPIMATWALLRITSTNIYWSTATAIAVGVLVATLTIVMILVLPRFTRMQTLTDNLNRVTREHLIGLPVVRAYNAEDYQAGKFDKANSELTNTQLFTSRTMSFMMPLMSLIMNGLTLAIFWTGAGLIKTASPIESVEIYGSMMQYTQYVAQVVMSFMLITMLFILVPRASVSARRMKEILDTQPSITSGSITECDIARRGEVEFRGVGFRYPEASDYVLRDISFTVKRGQTLAFIGSTGSGKSTLIGLIPRFFDATEGEVLVGGVDVRQYQTEALNNMLGYVPQKAVMFSGTVASNVAFGDSGKGGVDRDRINQAIEIAQATEFVSEMEGGIDSEIARGGTNISGGQKQRLAIARAVYRQPDILIFDDSFSALDYRTDRALRQALKDKTAGTTNIIVAQRIGTIKDADMIIVLDEGRIVGMGTHRQLLDECAIYKQIALSQLSEEEIG